MTALSWPFKHLPMVHFVLMPGVLAKFVSFGRPAAMVLVHPDMPPAIVNLETGELRELEVEPERGERVPTGAWGSA